MGLFWDRNKTANLMRLDYPVLESNEVLKTEEQNPTKTTCKSMNGVCQRYGSQQIISPPKLDRGERQNEKAGL